MFLQHLYNIFLNLCIMFVTSPTARLEIYVGINDAYITIWSSNKIKYP